MSDAPNAIETTQAVLSQSEFHGTLDKYVSSSIIDQSEAQLIRSYLSVQDTEGRVELLQTTGVSQTLLKFLSLHDPGTVKYVLALVDQALLIRPAIGSQFAHPKVFLNILNTHNLTSDNFIFWKASRVLSFLFGTLLGDNENVDELRQFLTILSNTSGQQEVYLFSLKGLLRKQWIRTLFKSLNGIDRLKALLSEKDLAVQTQYQIIFCVWLLSFDKENVRELVELIPRIVFIGRQTQKEKVLRISVAALRNLTVEPKNVEKMVESKLNKQLEIWNNRKWGDEDIKSDLEFLIVKTNHAIEEMSSYERYRSEVMSGELEWSPVHFSETFWRENVSRLGDDNFHLIRVLSELLSNPESKTLTKAVACYDIGEFVRLHPAGRKVVTDLGTKKIIMGLLYETGTDSEVQKQALLCTRKMMVSNWEMLGNSK